VTHAPRRVARVAALTIYPLKSAAGTEVPTITLDAMGAVGDRRWLLVHPDGAQITARECHALLRIRPIVQDHDRDGALMLTAAGRPPLPVDVPPADGERLTVEVWGDRFEALAAASEASAWCAEVIGRPCRLVRHGAVSHRPLKPKYTGGLPHEARTVTFTDGAPLLMLGLASIAALNDRLVEQGAVAIMDRRRFRANIWLDGIDAHEEDDWRSVRVGDVELWMGTRCLRCALTTVDPDTLEPGVEPLRTLATYRRDDGGVVFGVNTTPATTGIIRVGDTMAVERARDDAPLRSNER